MNVVLTLLDGRTDAAVLFAPYYFNHEMAITVPPPPSLRPRLWPQKCAVSEP